MEMTVREWLRHSNWNGWFKPDSTIQIKDNNTHEPMYYGEEENGNYRYDIFHQILESVIRYIEFEDNGKITLYVNPENQD